LALELGTKARIELLTGRCERKACRVQLPFRRRCEPDRQLFFQRALQEVGDA